MANLIWKQCLQPLPPWKEGLDEYLELPQAVTAPIKGA
jgi:hypothetical protein